MQSLETLVSLKWTVEAYTMPNHDRFHQIARRKLYALKHAHCRLNDMYKSPASMLH